MERFLTWITGWITALITLFAANPQEEQIDPTTKTIIYTTLATIISLATQLLTNWLKKVFDQRK